MEKAKSIYTNRRIVIPVGWLPLLTLGYKAIISSSIIMLLLLPIVFANSFPFLIRPLVNGTPQINKSFQVNLTFTLNSDGTGVLYSNVSNVNTDGGGIGLTNLNTSSLSSRPNYILEYRNGTLRKTHNNVDGLFNRVFAESLFLGWLTIYKNISITGLALYNSSEICTAANGLCAGGSGVLSVVGGFGLNSTNITTGGTLVVNDSVFQRRLSNCSILTAIRGAEQNGSPVCEPIPQGTITSIAFDKGFNRTTIVDEGTVVVNYSEVQHPVRGTQIGDVCIRNISAAGIVEYAAFKNQSGGDGTSNVTANNTKIQCGNITGGSDTDYCTDAGGSAGALNPNVFVNNITDTGSLMNKTLTNCLNISPSVGDSDPCTDATGAAGGGISETSYFQPAFPQKVIAWTRPVGLTATTFTSVGMTAFTVAGIPNALREPDGFYIRYQHQTAPNATQVRNATAGIVGVNVAEASKYTEIDYRYKPYWCTKIMTNNFTTNQVINIITTNETLNISRGNENGTNTNGVLGIGANYIGFRYRNNLNGSNNDSNWQYCWGNGTQGACFNSSIAVNPKSSYILCANMSNTTQVQYKINNTQYNTTINRSVFYNQTWGFQITSRRTNSSITDFKIAWVYLEVGT